MTFNKIDLFNYKSTFCKSKNLRKTFFAALIIISLFFGQVPILTETVVNTKDSVKTITGSELDYQSLQLALENKNSKISFERKLCIIQFKGPIEDFWRSEIESKGVEVISYLPEFSYLAMLSPVDSAVLNKLPYIRYIIPFDPELKYSMGAMDSYFSSSTTFDKEILIEFYPGDDDLKLRKNISEDITLLGADIISHSRNRITAKVDYTLIQEIAKLDNVLWLEPVPKFSYFTNVSSKIIDAERVWIDLGLDGTGQVLTICDTGLDNGSYTGLHKDFRGRLIHAYALGRSGNWSDDDLGIFGGHGTHVAGCAVGGGNMSSGAIKGMAPNASLVFQSTMNSMGFMNIPLDIYNGLYWPPYSSYNSRIHSNSWGNGSMGGQYIAICNDTDQFIWDHPDFIILFAAGNVGMSIDSTPPGTSKNVITVGASENYRKTPIFTGHEFDCDDKDDHWAYSCYGTNDDRLKPDVLAPGTGILATRSSLIQNPDNTYWKNFDDFYAYAGGTSMATPIAAGATTLIRQYYTDIKSVQPSAALVKATLINGAEDMPNPSGNTQPIPNYREGWGRVNVSRAIMPEAPANLFYIENNTGLKTDQSYTHVIEVLNDSAPLNITLVWSDRPANPAASRFLVNDIHLNVTHTKSGESFKGNVFENGWSTSDDSKANSDWDKFGTGYDNVNNVECLRIKKPKLGRYKITIIGYNIPYGPQPFAIAFTGGLEVNLLSPSNLQVTPLPTGNALNLTWETVTGNTISGYEIFRSLNEDTGYIKIGETQDPELDNYLDIGLVDGTTYYYKLRTKNIFGNFSNFSKIANGVPWDSIAPWLIINNPSPGITINKNYSINYENDTDCMKVVFKYYNDSNSNGLIDDENVWQLIGTDTILNGTFWWNTTTAGVGPGNQPAVILAAEVLDEVDNLNTLLVKNISVDNQPPNAPKLDAVPPLPINKLVINITGSAEKNAIVFIYSNGNLLNTTTSNSSSKFKVQVELFTGINNIIARATDSIGNGPGLPSTAKEVIVDVTPPVAEPGGNYTIDEHNWVTLNASGSYDTNPKPEFNYIVSYHWSFKLPDGSPVELEGMVVKYYFDEMGNYSITLTVADTANNKGTQHFWLLVNDTTKPTAIAPDDFTWDEDAVLNLITTRSSDNDPEFNLTGNFTWSFFDYPSINETDSGKIKKVELFGRNTSYIFEVPGEYNVILNTTDANGNWDVDQVTVTIRDITKPIANAGLDKTINQGRTINLDASGSKDNDPEFFETANFTWEIGFIGVKLYGITSNYRFDFTNKLTDVYNVRLTVTDRWGNSAWDELVIRVNPDLLNPIVLWSHPKDNSWNIPITTIIKIKLNETLDMEKAPLNNTNFQFLDGDYNEINGDLHYDPIESIILFVPDGLLNHGESYTVFLHDTLVDLAGNRLDGSGNGILEEGKDSFKFVFSTINLTLSPSDQASIEQLDTIINVQFSSFVSNFTLNSTKIKLTDKQTGDTIQGSIEIDFKDFAIRFIPDKELASGKEYLVMMIYYYYLLPNDTITWDSTHRERLDVEFNQNLTKLNDSNVTQKIESWSFDTKSKEESDDEDFISKNFSLIMLSLIGVIILIIIILFIFIHRRRKAKAREEMEEQPEIGRRKPRPRTRDKYYEEEVEEYYPYNEYEDKYEEHEAWEWEEDDKVRKTAKVRRVTRRKTPRKIPAKVKPKRKKGTQISRARVSSTTTRRRKQAHREKVEYEEDEFEYDYEEEFPEMFEEDEDEFEEEEYVEEDELDLAWDEEEDEVEGEVEEFEELEELEGKEPEVPEEMEELEEAEELDEELDELEELEELDSE